MALLFLATAGAASAQSCGGPILPQPLTPPPTYPLLDAAALGVVGASWGQNLAHLVDDIYANPSTRRVLIAGVWYQLPPWFDLGRSTGDKLCTDPWLHRGGESNPILVAPTLAPENYLVVSDELSELALLTAATADSAHVERMREIDRTVQALIMGPGPREGLPCWVGWVHDGTFGCHPQRLDSATDATVRFALAYFAAYRNQALPPADRTLYLSRAESLLTRHLDLEYQHRALPCPTSDLTGAAVPICDWVAAGANTAAGAAEMYIGYYPDVVKLLLAGYTNSRNPALLELAEDVIHQYLLASTFTGDASFGRVNFKWQFGAPGSNPQPVEGDSAYHYYWQSGRAWDVDDAPRALWIGDVLRAHHLATGVVDPPTIYHLLADWTVAVLGGAGQSELCSCVEYNADGTFVAGNCGTGHYYNGLGLGLETRLAASQAEAKLRAALAHYRWDLARWDDQNIPSPDRGCFFLYRGVRTVKALAALIGADEGALRAEQLLVDGFESGTLARWNVSLAAPPSLSPKPLQPRRTNLELNSRRFQ